MIVKFNKQILDKVCLSNVSFKLTICQFRFRETDIEKPRFWYHK